MRIVRLVGVVVLWLLQFLMAVGFVIIGIAKFGDPSWARNFARWGYPDGFYMVIGALEAAGGVALLVPRFTSYTAAVLGVIMRTSITSRPRATTWNCTLEPPPIWFGTRSAPWRPGSIRRDLCGFTVL
jgi:uncharacterized membrane protein YphA (DoxX/SURF4 family)